MGEIWKDIKGYEHRYQISNYGRVKSLRYRGHNKVAIMKPEETKHGYLQIMLGVPNKRKRYKIHRLVADHFLNNPENKPQVNHLDENKLNNHVDNLSWCTSKENINHGTRTDRAKNSMKNSSKFKKAVENRAISKRNKILGIHMVTGHIVRYDSGVEAEGKGFTRSHIYACIKGKRNHHLGYKWYKQSDFEQKENKRCM